MFIAAHHHTYGAPEERNVHADLHVAPNGANLGVAREL